MRSKKRSLSTDLLVFRSSSVPRKIPSALPCSGHFILNLSKKYLKIILEILKRKWNKSESRNDVEYGSNSYQVVSMEMMH